MDSFRLKEIPTEKWYSFLNHILIVEFQVQVASILSSKLDEILFLDSDNTAVTDPSFLFDSQAFIETGAIFWKDFWKTNPKNPIWDILELECVDEFEQESGQVFPFIVYSFFLFLILDANQQEISWGYESS